MHPSPLRCEHPVMPARVVPESAVMAWAMALRSEHDDENCKRGDSV